MLIDPRDKPTAKVAKTGQRDLRRVANLRRGFKIVGCESCMDSAALADATQTALQSPRKCAMVFGNPRGIL